MRRKYVTGLMYFNRGWQLQHLSRDGKWDVKNLAKWKSVKPVSEPIGGIFRVSFFINFPSALESNVHRP